MSYTASLSPQVIKTYPDNYDTNVLSNQVIRIYFNVDLDKMSVQSSLLVTDEQGIKIPGTIVYKLEKDLMTQESSKKDMPVIIFTPTTPFAALQIVKVTVIGDDFSSEQKLGIRSITKEYMAGDYHFTFTVANYLGLSKPLLSSPTNQSVLSTNPPFRFEWQQTTNANYYQIQISNTNTFAFVYWPLDWQNYRIENIPNQLQGIQSSYSFTEDGTYYWRVRAIQDISIPEISSNQLVSQTLPAGTYNITPYSYNLGKTNIVADGLFVKDDDGILYEGTNFTIDYQKGILLYKKNITVSKTLYIGFKYVVSFAKNTNISPWSEPYSFYKNSLTQGNVSVDDTPRPDGLNPSIQYLKPTVIDEINVWPKDNSFNISTRLNKIVVDVHGQYTLAQVQNSLTINEIDVAKDFNEANLTPFLINSVVIDSYDALTNTTRIIYNLKQIT